MKTDESNIGIILWIILLLNVNVQWIAMDWWLHRHGHEYLTTEVREALQSSGAWGLVISFVVGGVLLMAAFHFAYQRTI